MCSTRSVISISPWDSELTFSPQGTISMLPLWRLSTRSERDSRTLVLLTLKLPTSSSWMFSVASDRELTRSSKPLLMDSNEVVHSHIKNMSMAQVIPRHRPSVSPKVRGAEDDDRSSGEHERGIGAKDVKERDLIKDRSPLADMLYLRCKSPSPYCCLELIGRAGWVEAAVARNLREQCGIDERPVYD